MKISINISPFFLKKVKIGVWQLSIPALSPKHNHKMTRTTLQARCQFFQTKLSDFALHIHGYTYPGYLAVWPACLHGRWNWGCIIMLTQQVYHVYRMGGRVRSEKKWVNSFPWHILGTKQPQRTKESCWLGTWLSATQTSYKRLPN